MPSIFDHMCTRHPDKFIGGPIGERIERSKIGARRVSVPVFKHAFLTLKGGRLWL